MSSGRPSKWRARLLLSRSDAHSGLVQLRANARASSVWLVDYRRRRVSSSPLVPRLVAVAVRLMDEGAPLMVSAFLVLPTAAPRVMVQAVVACLVRSTAAEGTLSSFSSCVDGRRGHLASASSLSLAQRLVVLLVLILRAVMILRMVVLPWELMF